MSPELALCAREVLRECSLRFASEPLAALRASPPRRDELEPLVELLDSHRAELGRWLSELEPKPDGPATFADDPCGFLGLSLTRWLQSKNQFLELGAATLTRLSALARATLGSLCALLDREPERSDLGQALEALAREAHRGLFAIVDELDRASPAPGFAYRDLVCEEYSPELQLRVLGLAADELLEPILDLGCGERALLVNHLASYGKRALGIDRVAEPRRGVLAGDWLETPLPADTFGTVISHLGFSHHFSFQHLSSGATLERYARRYMQILNALAAGGTFAYAPGLGFVEEHLPPERWRLERREVSELADPVSNAQIYATRVTRLG
jgi:hypothetical protein